MSTDSTSSGWSPAGGPCPVLTSCYLASQAAEALHSIQEHSLIHGDVRPGNLLLTEDGERPVLRLMKLGQARATRRDAYADRDSAGLPLELSRRTLAAPSHLSSRWTAPELLTGSNPADIRADIYGLGCTLYYLLSGHPPFPGAGDNRKREGRGAPGPAALNLIRPEVPAEFAAVVSRMDGRKPGATIPDATRGRQGTGSLPAHVGRGRRCRADGVRRRQDRRRVIRIRDHRFIIGRTEGDFCIPLDGRMSARHVEITHQVVGGLHRWVVTDLQSTHGMFVRVSRTVLADKAEFLVGNGRYRFDAPQVDAGPTIDRLRRNEPGFSETHGLDEGRQPIPAAGRDRAARQGDRQPDPARQERILDRLRPDVPDLPAG